MCRTVALYGIGILKIPKTSLVEELKCAKTSLEMTVNRTLLRKTVKSKNTEEVESMKSGSTCTRRKCRVEERGLS